MYKRFEFGKSTGVMLAFTTNSSSHYKNFGIECSWVTWASEKPCFNICIMLWTACFVLSIGGGPKDEPSK